jgi:hypothetical protein
MLISDFEKLDAKKITHYIYKTVAVLQDEEYYEENTVLATTHLLKKLLEVVPEDMKETEEQRNKIENLAFKFSATQRFSFPPIAAFIGGVATQEIVKAITQKYTPIKQLFYFDCSELYPVDDITSLNDQSKKDLFKFANDNDDRYTGLKMCLGSDLVDSI